ncbi:MAG: hypothetical protein WDO16_24355 [Bacteroidota bacterium]
MKYIQVYALFLMLVFCTSCGGQNKPDLPKENIKSETKDIVTSTGSNETYHTKYEYTDSNGKSLIIQNSFPRGGKYTDPNGKEYFKSILWTRIINETDNPFELTIDFSGDSYELPFSVGSSVDNYRKIILLSDTMTRDKEDLFNYGLTDLDSFLVNSIHKPSSLKRTINPKESSGFYVVMLFIKPKSGWQKVKGDGNGYTRAGFSLKGQNLFYTVNGKEIHCGKINLKNLILKK